MSDPQPKPPEGPGTTFWVFWGLFGLALLVATSIGLWMFVRIDAG